MPNSPHGWASAKAHALLIKTAVHRTVLPSKVSPARCGLTIRAPLEPGVECIDHLLGHSTTAGCAVNDTASPVHQLDLEFSTRKRPVGDCPCEVEERSSVGAASKPRYLAAMQPSTRPPRGHDDVIASHGYSGEGQPQPKPDSHDEKHDANGFEDRWRCNSSQIDQLIGFLLPAASPRPLGGPRDRFCRTS